VANGKTAGHELFEDFLHKQGGYDFAFQPDLAAELGAEIDHTRPDYLVRWVGGLAVCEVKHFTRTALDDRFKLGGYVAASDAEVYGPIRNKLRQGARSLWALRGLGVPLVIVLADPVGVVIDLRPFADAGLMVAVVNVDHPAGEVNLAAGDPMPDRDGIMVRQPGHISAVVVVHSAEAADVFEIGDEAAVRLPAGAFEDGRGERYGYLPDGRYGAAGARHLSA
jgi:hypothetical protein